MDLNYSIVKNQIHKSVIIVLLQKIMAMSENIQKQKSEETPLTFAFERKNYILLITGLIILVMGFILMSGGGSDDPEVFSDAMFDFRRLTLAPILIIAGYVIELYAIMYRKK